MNLEIVSRKYNITNYCCLFLFVRCYAFGMLIGKWTRNVASDGYTGVIGYADSEYDIANIHVYVL